MTGWKARRFWKTAQAVPLGTGFTVHLDGRPLRTPGKQPFLVPTLAMAQAAAAEWDAQTGEVQPALMPVTRFANSAIEKVAPQFQAVVDVVAAYGGSDLLCYRAEEPQALVARQAQGWDPLLAWADQALGAPLDTTGGLMPVVQPSASLSRLREAVAALTPFQLAGLHDLVAISGSLILGLAVAQGRLDVDAAFDLSRIDEHWQADLWGRDDEAVEVESRKRADMRTAAAFFALCG